MILGRELTRETRRAVLKMGILDVIDEKESGVPHRPSQLLGLTKLNMNVWSKKVLASSCS